MADQNKKQSGGFNPIGLCMGVGVGLCFGVALGQHAPSDNKKDEKSGEDKQ